MHPNDTPNTESPYGYCKCGCGQKTKLATNTDHRTGAVKGQPQRYLMGHARPPKHPAPIELFWSKVDKSGGEDACWIWTAYCYPAGYGHAWWNGRNELAHRVSYQLAKGEIPGGLMVLHNCPDGDNPSCVNPAHLWLGTTQENTADRDRKGRKAHGERGGMHKLTHEQVAEARRMYAEGGISQREIGELFGVSQVAIGLIVRNVNWKE